MNTKTIFNRIQAVTRKHSTALIGIFSLFMITQCHNNRVSERPKSILNNECANSDVNGRSPSPKIEHCTCINGTDGPPGKCSEPPCNGSIDKSCPTKSCLAAAEIPALYWLANDEGFHHECGRLDPNGWQWAFSTNNKGYLLHGLYFKTADVCKFNVGIHGSSPGGTNIGFDIVADQGQTTIRSVERRNVPNGDFCIPIENVVFAEADNEIRVLPPNDKANHTLTINWIKVVAAGNPCE